MSMSKEYVPDRRGRVAEKIMDWGNLVFAGLVVSQAFSNRFSWSHALTGGVVFAIAYLVAVLMMRGGEVSGER
jgi:hypothetical protein